MKTILLTLTCLTALISCTSTTPNPHPATHKSGSGIGISNESGSTEIYGSMGVSARGCLQFSELAPLPVGQALLVRRTREGLG